MGQTSYYICINYGNEVQALKNKLQFAKGELQEKNSIIMKQVKIRMKLADRLKEK